MHRVISSDISQWKNVLSLFATPHILWLSSNLSHCSKRCQDMMISEKVCQVELNALVFILDLVRSTQAHHAH